MVGPKPYVGMQVLWHPDTNNVNHEAAPAFVLRVGHEVLSLAVFRLDSLMIWQMEGVRHASDPATQRPELREAGGWTHTPQTLELEALKEDMAGLTTALGVSKAASRN